MNLETQFAKIGKHFINIQGWRTNRRIVVIESDDWGSIRMPSRDVYEKCLKAGYPVDKTPYERFDSLLSCADLELLFELLTGFRDKSGNHPVITANSVVTNPDFEKIENSDFEKYYYESITDTFKKYPEHTNNFKLWKEGIKNGLFFPQFHAREHLNVSMFMDALRRKEPDVLFSFGNRMPGCIKTGSELKGNSYVEATNYNSLSDKQQKLDIFLEGLDLFEKLFGYRSESIIPPNYIWSPDFNKAVLNKGVMYFQGIRKFREPSMNGSFRYYSVYTGKRNQLGQTYIVRNCFFEPSMFKLGIANPVGKCLSDMDIAFRMRKPAIIGSHRLNYAGFIDEKNRDRTLKMMNGILTAALKRWPDIEFMTSEQLGKTIAYEEI